MTGSQLSDDPKDKLAACFNWVVGKWQGKTVAATYQVAPMYFDAAWEWYQGLTAQQQEIVRTIHDAYSPDRRKEAENWAAVLPSAPRCRMRASLPPNRERRSIPRMREIASWLVIVGLIGAVVVGIAHFVGP